MPLESLTGASVFIDDLVNTNPVGASDPKSEGDDHIRGIKNVLLNSFPGVTGAVSATHTELNTLDGITANVNELNYSDGVTSNIQTQLDAKAPAFKGSLVYIDGNQSIANNDGTEKIAFDQESYDTSTIHDTVTNNSRLTVPAGVTKVRLTAGLSFAANATGYRSASFHKNGVSTYVGLVSAQELSPTAGQFANLYLTSPVLTVVATDYFELFCFQNSGGALNAQGTADGRLTWFAMELIA